MAILLVYLTSSINSSQKFVATSKWRPFWKLWNMKRSFVLTSDMKRSSQIMPKVFHGDNMINDVTGWPQIRPSILMFGRGFMFGRGSFREQVVVKDNVSPIHVNIIMVFLGYTYLKKISMNNIFPRSQVKSQRHRLTRWPWHLNGRNSVNFGIIKMKQQLKCKK